MPIFSIILNIIASLWQSQVGRLAIVAVIAGAVGYHKGFQKGDEGRLALKQEYDRATTKLLTDEAARNRQIVSQSSEDAAAHEAEMAEKDKLLEEAAGKIAALEKETVCKVGKATIRALNSSR